MSRSSLANYETGRSRPSGYVLDKISEIVDIPRSYFDLIDQTDQPDLAMLLGAVVEGRPKFTDDEIAIVRVLRLCDKSTAKAVVGRILEAVTSNSVAGNLVDILNLSEDLATLARILESKGLYYKGDMSVDGETLLHQINLKRLKDKGPQ